MGPRARRPRRSRWDQPACPVLEQAGTSRPGAARDEAHRECRTGCGWHERRVVRRGSWLSCPPVPIERVEARGPARRRRRSAAAGQGASGLQPGFSIGARVKREQPPAVRPGLVRLWEGAQSQGSQHDLRTYHRVCKAGRTPTRSAAAYPTRGVAASLGVCAGNGVRARFPAAIRISHRAAHAGGVRKGTRVGARLRGAREQPHDLTFPVIPRCVILPTAQKSNRTAGGKPEHVRPCVEVLVALSRRESTRGPRALPTGSGGGATPALGPPDRDRFLPQPLVLRVVNRESPFAHQKGGRRIRMRVSPDSRRDAGGVRGLRSLPQGRLEQLRRQEDEVNRRWRPAEHPAEPSRQPRVGGGGSGGRSAFNRNLLLVPLELPEEPWIRRSRLSNESCVLQRLGKGHPLLSEQECSEECGRPALAHMTVHEHRTAARQGVTDERVAPLEVG
eukprot:scaffold13717_cov132-Isochrysis_galbana.AAC.5